MATKLFGLLLTKAIYVSASACYFPDGKTTTPDVPCNQSAIDAGGHSPCCNEAALCLDNGLCFGQGIMSRGSCTDAEWGEECPQYCKDVNGEPSSSGMPLTPCNVFTPTFFCGANTDNCITGEGVFTLEDGNGIVLRDSQVAPIEKKGTSTAFLVDASTTLYPAVDSGNGSAVTITASANPDLQYSTGDIAATAAGTGGPLLLAVIGAIFVIINLRRKLRQARTEQHQAEADANEKSRVVQQNSYSNSTRSGYASTPNVPYNSPAGGYYPSPEHNLSNNGYYPTAHQQHGQAFREMDDHGIREIGDHGLREMGAELPYLEMDGESQAQRQAQWQSSQKQ